MDSIENVYAFWDFVVEQSYKTELDVIRERTAHSFENETAKNIYMFGCNDASVEFIRIFRDKLRFTGVFDNASSKWDSGFEGLTVLCPEEVIPTLDPKRDVIVVSMRLSTDIVARQIENLGFTNYFSLAVMISTMKPYSDWIERSRDFLKAELQDIVMLESTNDFDGNCGALYRYLKNRGSKHKFVWILKESRNKTLLPDDNDEALCPSDNYDDLLRYVEIRAKAKWQIYDNTPILKVRDDQVNVFLQHFGMGYKKINKFYRCPQYVDHVLTTNEFVRKMEQDSICYPKSAGFIYGELPRNDVLYSKWNELSLLTDKKYKKVILWAPTMRESGNNRKDSDISYPYGVSLIYDTKDMRVLDECMRNLESLLIIKPHPRQKLNYSDTDLGNVMYLTGERVKEIDSYKLLTQIDAMITDYSSMVFDYMLLDRPCAWVLEDREHYKIEYLMDDPDEYMPGHKIYTMEDMITFLSDVADGKDPYREERRKICNRCNPPFEGKGCEKLVEVLGL